MIEARYTWQGDAMIAAAEARLWEGIQRAGVHLHNRILEVLNVSAQPYSVRSRARRTRSGRPASYTRYRDPSRPGEPPRKRTGWLQRNVKLQLVRSRMLIRIGLVRNASYGVDLEYGTDRMRPRPWLRSTMTAELSAMRALIRQRAQDPRGGR